MKMMKKTTTSESHSVENVMLMSEQFDFSARQTNVMSVNRSELIFILSFNHYLDRMFYGRSATHFLSYCFTIRFMTVFLFFLSRSRSLNMSIHMYACTYWIFKMQFLENECFSHTKVLLPFFYPFCFILSICFICDSVFALVFSACYRYYFCITS